MDSVGPIGENSSTNSHIILIRPREQKSHHVYEMWLKPTHLFLEFHCSCQALFSQGLKLL